MPIRQDQLFDYVIPALLFLFAGVFIFNKDVSLSSLLKKIDKKEAAQLGHLLLTISFLIDGLRLIGVPGVQSIHSFTYFLRYIGAMCYLFSPSTLHYLLLVIVYLSLAQHALSGGVFIDFFMWSTYLFVMASLKFGWSFKLRATFIVLAIPLLLIIQSIKSEYREATWEGKRKSGIGLATELASKQQEQEKEPFAESEGVIRTVGRLNQGWHMGKVLKWVPRHQPYAFGEDLWGDVEAAILPRVFFPEKKKGGTQDKFFKYTGHKLRKSTSMTIGVLGDFYINFGRTGSFIALFIFGAVVSRLFYLFIKKYVVTDPINIIWIPFLFSYLIRANNDFYFILNNLVKGFLLFLLLNYLRKQFWSKRNIQDIQ